jgi:cytochrome P450
MMKFRQKFDEWMFTSEMLVSLAREKVSTGIVFNPMQEALRSDPFPIYRALREHSPIHRSYLADGWVLSRYADVEAVLTDRGFGCDERKFTRYPKLEARSRRAGIPSSYENGLATMLREDAPNHTRLRALASNAFTPRAVSRMRPQIEGLLEVAFKRIPTRGSFDLISRFAAPFPIMVIAGILGVPASDWDRFYAWSEDIVMSIGDGNRDQREIAERARIELGQYLREVANERRSDPRGDVISSLAQSEEDGDQLSTDELVSIATLLLVAGNETTTKLIGNSMLALLAHPDQLEFLRKEPERIPAAVEELLRFDGPVQMTSRVVLEDRKFRGRDFKKGQQILLVLAAANRDPERFEDPDRLDVTREDCRHLAFSKGAHFCLGAKLARLETSLALEALITRLPGLRLADGAAGVEWGTNTILRGPQRLQLEAGSS